jgi:hypothetical protein
LRDKTGPSPPPRKLKNKENLAELPLWALNADHDFLKRKLESSKIDGDGRKSSKINHRRNSRELKKRLERLKAEIKKRRKSENHEHFG